jgi:hypothetical protein
VDLHQDGSLLLDIAGKMFTYFVLLFRESSYGQGKRKPTPRTGLPPRGG